MSTKILIGADPELFLRNPATGLFVSAHGLLPGTKADPFRCSSAVQVQVDGMAAEFNIAPTDNADQFVSYNQDALTRIRNWKSIQDAGLEVVIEPTAVFEQGYWDSLPDDPKELGCNPDWNAWTGQVNPKPDAAATTMRTASGHIHIGWTQGEDPFDPVHFQDCCIVARQMDHYLGAYSVMWDQDVERRKLYGKAGAFRPKAYGMEYRTMSNRWLSSTRLMSWVWQAANHGMQQLFAGRVAEENFKHQEVVAVINNGEKWWLEDHPLSVLLPMVTGLYIPPVEGAKPKSERKKKSATWMFPPTSTTGGVPILTQAMLDASAAHAAPLDTGPNWGAVVQQVAHN